MATLDMAPFYEEICPEVGWTIDQTLLDIIKKENTRNLESLEKAIEDAETNLGETEVRDALLEKAEYLCKIGDKVYTSTTTFFHTLCIIRKLYVDFGCSMPV